MSPTIPASLIFNMLYMQHICSSSTSMPGTATHLQQLYDTGCEAALQQHQLQGQHSRRHPQFHSYVRLASLQAQVLPRATQQSRKSHSRSVVMAAGPGAAVPEAAVPVAAVLEAAIREAEVPEAAVPDLQHADSAIVCRIHMLDKTRKMIVFKAYFAAGMNRRGVANIIRALARKGLASVAEHGLRDTENSIVFLADFGPSSDSKVWRIEDAMILANIVLEKGWEGLLFLPLQWHVKTIWDIVADRRLALPFRRTLSKDGTYPAFVKGGGKNKIRFSCHPKQQHLYHSTVQFCALYPECNLGTPGWPLLRGAASTPDAPP